MTEALALKYRPSTFPEMIGQKLTAASLAQMVAVDRVPQGMLFSGPSGTGKTTAARILARSLNPESQFQETVELDAASNGGVESARTLIEQLRYSTGGAYRVVIIDEAHSMTREAFNALLKTLEEPPAGTIFVLVTTEPEKLPETILTRLIEFEFRRVAPAEIFDRLLFVAGQEKLTISTELLHFLAQYADGSVRKALMRLDQVSLAGVTSVAEYQELTGDRDDAPELVAALMTGDEAHIFTALDKLLDATGNPNRIYVEVIGVLRDILVIRSGGTLQIEGAGFEARRELALRLEKERVLAALNILWQLKTRVRGTENPRTNLEVALILVAEVFTRGKALAAPQVVTPPPVSAATTPVSDPVVVPRKLTLAEMQARR